jgi:hypothetical protein
VGRVAGDEHPPAAISLGDFRMAMESRRMRDLSELDCGEVAMEGGRCFADEVRIIGTRPQVNSPAVLRKRSQNYGQFVEVAIDRFVRIGPAG